MHGRAEHVLCHILKPYIVRVPQSKHCALVNYVHESSEKENAYADPILKYLYASGACSVARWRYASLYTM